MKKTEKVGVVLAVVIGGIFLLPWVFLAFTLSLFRAHEFYCHQTGMELATITPGYKGYRQCVV